MTWTTIISSCIISIVFTCTSFNNTKYQLCLHIFVLRVHAHCFLCTFIFLRNKHSILKDTSFQRQEGGGAHRTSDYQCYVLYTDLFSRKHIHTYNIRVNKFCLYFLQPFPADQILCLKPKYDFTQIKLISCSDDYRVIEINSIVEIE